MKSVKLLSLIMALLMVCCTLAGCGGNGAETTTGPVAPAYSVTVSFKVVDMTGETTMDVASYNYQSGTTAPTPYAVLDDYCYMNFDNGEGMVKVADGRLVSIDKLAAEDGTSYWSITVNGKDIAPAEFTTQELASGDTLVITLKDSSQAKG